jgi:hypothetical protein
MYTNLSLAYVSPEVKRKAVWTQLYEYELCKGCGEVCKKCEEHVVPKLQNKLYESCQFCLEKEQREQMLRSGATHVLPIKRKKTAEEIERDAKTKAKSKIQAEQAKARKLLKKQQTGASSTSTYKKQSIFNSDEKK